MKKLLLLATFGVAGLVSAKNTELTSIKTISVNETTEVSVSAESKVFFRGGEPIRVTTVCGATYVTVSGSQETLYDEWEGMNQQLCGHYSYENPVT